MDLASKVPLSNRAAIPLIGLGVWKMAEGQETENAVKWALEAGYRHIDTATYYANERSVGKAVRESGIPRAEVFVTTKLWPTDFLNAARAFEQSFEKLGIGPIDLYLIHWPVPLMPKRVWKTLESLYEDGRVRAIGVSNFGIDDLEALMKYARVLPMANQVEFNPESHDLALLSYCKERNIVVEAYSPLGRGRLLGDETVRSMAAKYRKTPAQILIRWALEHDTVPLPKSSNKKHIIENTEVFDFALEPKDIEALEQLG